MYNIMRRVKIKNILYSIDEDIFLIDYFDFDSMHLLPDIEIFDEEEGELEFEFFE